MQRLRISYDQGSSLVKAFYQINQRVGVMAMEPEILYLPMTSIQSYKEGATALNASFPENDAWLSYKKRAEHCYVLGHLAKQFHGSPKLDQLKFEQGTAKLMAIIGAIIQREGLDSEIEVEISALLPFGEYANRQQLIDQFSREAKNYYFREQKINVSTEGFACYPEGGGFVTGIIREKSKQWLAQRRIVVLMCGHRNTSLLVFEKGMLSDASQTTDLGFIRLVEGVIKKTALDSAESLTKAIYKVGPDIDPKNPDLRVLVRAYEAGNFETEAEQIAEAIQNSRQEYWALIRDWLRSNVPDEMDEMIIAGGAAYYLKGNLDRFLAWAEPSWHRGEIPPQLKSAFADFPDQDSLIVRFRDVCALHMGIY
jgi:hypothetical protein